MTESVPDTQSIELMIGIVAVGGKFEFASLERPFKTKASEVLVKVERISLNRGELAFPWISGSAIGWDAYGTVVETSDDGEGPVVGARYPSGGSCSYPQVVAGVIPFIARPLSGWDRS